MKNKEIYVAGLVLGILSIICTFTSLLLGGIFGIVGINLNVKNKNKKNTKAGLVCSIIGLSLYINKLLIVIAIIISVL